MVIVPATNFETSQPFKEKLSQGNALTLLMGLQRLRKPHLGWMKPMNIQLKQGICIPLTEPSVRSHASGGRIFGGVFAKGTHLRVVLSEAKQLS